MAGYTKAYVGFLTVVYDGTNVQEVLDLVAGTGPIEFRLGNLYVFGELINVGDAVRVEDEAPVVPATKIPEAQVITDMHRINAVVYNLTNADAIMAFTGNDAVTIAPGGLYVNGVLMGDGDAIARPSPRSNPVRISAAALAADYVAD